MTRTKGAKDKGPRAKRAKEKVKRQPRAIETEPRTATHAQVVELHLSGWTSPEIAEFRGLDRRLIHHHIKRYHRRQSEKSART